MENENNAVINWRLIGDAVAFYQSHGFRYIETPWIVEMDDILVTCPNPERVIKTNFHDGGLVGSAEQGFISMARNQTLPEGSNFVSCGPCFRWETPFDKLHQLNFMKVELFSRLDFTESGESVTQELVNRATKFMSRYNTVDIIDTETGKDITVNGIEVGSYGYRYHPGIGWWAYGTGLAEPRFTQALEFHS